MRSAGVPVLLNPHSLTLVFPKPAEAIIKEYQLACYRYDAHAIVMPSVSDLLIARFLYDYFEWWNLENGAQAPTKAQSSTNLLGSLGGERHPPCTTQTMISRTISSQSDPEFSCVPFATF